jgi:MoxR-like ATPase
MSSLQYKSELALVRAQNIDITNFENELELFKGAFAKNYDLASRRFQTAIDEIDKSDEAFEALLLEVLADYQVTIPEIGTIQAQTPPLVILTSNNTRELGDALKRRCLHLHVGFPDADREQQIVRARVPDIAQSLLKQMVDFVQSLREQDIRKLPSISETVDWARTLLLLHAEALDPALVRSTLSVLLKRQTDVISLDAKLDSLTHSAVTGPGATA